MTIQNKEFKPVAFNVETTENINEILKRDTKKILITTNNGFYEVVDLPYHKEKFITDKRDEWFERGAKEVKFTTIELKDSLTVSKDNNYNEKLFIKEKNK